MRSALWRNLGITFTENVLSKGLSLLIILTLTRMLGPEDYGRYSFIFVTVALGSALFDFGMENTAVRFTAKEKQLKYSIFGLYLVIKLLILTGLLLFLLLAGGPFFTLLNKPEISKYIPFVIFGLLGESLFLVNDTWLQANQQFRFRAILNVFRYAVSLAFIGALAMGHRLWLEWVLYLYLVPLGICALFMGQYFRFVRAWLRRPIKRGLMLEIGRYQSWMLAGSIANNLLGRVDFFLLGLWVGFHQLGIYNAAYQLCAVVSFLPLALGKVLLPALSELSEPEIISTTGDVLRGTFLMALSALCLVPLIPWVLPALLGEAYAEAVVVLQILLLAFVMSLLAMPYDQALYSLGKPGILSVGRYVQLGLIVVLNLAVIPFWGIYGAALVTLAGRVMYLFFVRQRYRALELAMSPGLEAAA